MTLVPRYSSKLPIDTLNWYRKYPSLIGLRESIELNLVRKDRQKYYIRKEEYNMISTRSTPSKVIALVTFGRHAGMLSM